MDSRMVCITRSTGRSHYVQRWPHIFFDCLSLSEDPVGLFVFSFSVSPRRWSHGNAAPIRESCAHTPASINKHQPAIAAAAETAVNTLFFYIQPPDLLMREIGYGDYHWE